MRWLMTLGLALACLAASGCSTADPLTGGDAQERIEARTPEAGSQFTAYDYVIGADGTISGVSIIRATAVSSFAEDVASFGSLDALVGVIEAQLQKTQRSLRCSIVDWGGGYSVKCAWANEIAQPGTAWSVSLEDRRITFDIVQESSPDNAWDLKVTMPGPILSVEGSGADALRDERSIRMISTGETMTYSISSER